MAEEQTKEDLAVELEELRTKRAIAVAENVERVAEKATNAREDLAAKLAYAAGAEAARIDDRLNNLDNSVERINGNIKETATALHELTDEVRKMREATIARDSASKALVDAVEMRASQQVTTRMFLFSLIGAVGTISGVLWAAVGNL